MSGSDAVVEKSIGHRAHVTWRHANLSLRGSVKNVVFRWKPKDLDKDKLKMHLLTKIKFYFRVLVKQLLVVWCIFENKGNYFEYQY